jgi:hypothetical protein
MLMPPRPHACFPKPATPKAESIQGAVGAWGDQHVSAQSPFRRRCGLRRDWTCPEKHHRAPAILCRAGRWLPLAVRPIRASSPDRVDDKLGQTDGRIQPR